MKNRELFEIALNLKFFFLTKNYDPIIYVFSRNKREN